MYSPVIELVGPTLAVMGLMRQGGFMLGMRGLRTMDPVDPPHYTCSQYQAWRGSIKGGDLAQFRADQSRVLHLSQGGKPGSSLKLEAACYLEEPPGGRDN